MERQQGITCRPSFPAPPIGCNSTRISASTDAAALAPYLARLGVSHVYASPYLKARPGSTHGYDIVDHDAAQPGAWRRGRRSTRMVRRLSRQQAWADPRFRAESHGRRRRRQSVVARRAGMGPGLGLRGMVRHRLGPGPALPARQAAGAVSGRPVRRGAGGAASSRCKFDEQERQLRGLGLRHAQAADLPAAL